MKTKTHPPAEKKDSGQKPVSIVDVLCVLILYDRFDEKKILKELRKITKGGIYDA